MRWRPVALALLAAGLVATAGCSGLVSPDTDTQPAPPYIEHEGENVTVHPESGQVIAGETTLDAGTTVVVRAQSTGGSSPFLVSSSTNVTEGGSFEATLDFSDAPSGATFDVTVLHNGSSVVTADGVVA